MPMYVRVGGAWKEVVSGTSVRVGEAWKEITNGYVRVGGAWKEFYSAAISPLMTRGIQSGGGKTPTVTGYSIGLGIGSLGEPDEWRGSLISGISTAGAVLSVLIDGSHPQNFFTTFICSLGTFHSVDATYTDTGDNTQWQWPSGSNFPGSGTETVTIG